MPEGQQVKPWLSPDQVSFALDSGDQPLPTGSVQFLAEVVNVDLDRLRKHVGIFAPHVLEDLFLADDTAHVAHQVLQDAELLGRQRDLLISHGCSDGVGVEYQVASSEDRSSGVRPLGAG